MKNLIDILLESTLADQANMMPYMKHFEGRLPKKFYHVSNPQYRDDILKNGLKPMKGASYELHWESEYPDFEALPCIFLASDNEYDSTYDDDRYEIDAKFIDIKKLFYDLDKDRKGNLLHAEKWYMYFDEIPPKALKLIHKGTGE